MQGFAQLTWELKGTQEIKSFKIPKENRWVNPHWRSHRLGLGSRSRKT